MRKMKKPLLSKKEMQHCLGLKSSIWTNRRTSRTMSFGQISPKWKWLPIMHSTTFKYSISAQTPHIDWNHSARGKMMSWTCFLAIANGHFIVEELNIHLSVYQSVLQPNVRPPVEQLKPAKLSHLLGQWFQIKQQAYNRIAVESRCCNVPFKVQTTTQWKCEVRN